MVETVNSPQDPREVAKFDALAARWWDPSGEMKALHAINPLRLAYIEERLGGLEGRRVVDVGCGGGLLAEALAAKGARVTGIDPATLALEVARHHAASQGLAVDYRPVAAAELALAEANTFDAVVCMEVLEHVPDPQGLVGACGQLLRPGGFGFFSTLNRTPKAFWLAIVAGEYLLGLLPRGTHQYRRFIKPSELAHWLKAADINLKALTGLHYNPLTKTYWLDPPGGPGGVGVNYFAYGRKS
ncbi:MAG: bifunctional 2-polyprenyl-6-hydroxyphenol methylase/3-demethylubiquinol 3-O-methyltransferase UbiG [Candidatus Competibacterales bacterium]